MIHGGVSDWDQYEVEFNNGVVDTVIWRCLKHNLLPIGIVKRYTKTYCAI